MTLTAPRSEELARPVTTELGKTLGDAHEVARMVEMVQPACAIPATMQGRILEGVSRDSTRAQAGDATRIPDGERSAPSGENPQRGTSGSEISACSAVPRIWPSSR